MSFVESLLKSNKVLNNKLISFSLGEEKYTAEILSVQHVKSCNVPLNIPHVPVYIRGSITVDRWVAPVMDIHQYCGRKTRALKSYKVAVLRLTEDATIKLIRFVNGNLPSDELLPQQDHQSDLSNKIMNIYTDYIVGIAIVDDKTVILMDADKLADSGLMG